MKICNPAKTVKILVLLIFICVQPGKAETLLGSVSKDGKPVRGMEIRLSNPNSSISKAIYPAFTNSNGEYSFTQLPSANGYILEYYWAGNLVRKKQFDLIKTKFIEEQF